MTANPVKSLGQIKSRGTLYVLHLSSGKAQIYHIQSNRSARIDLPGGLQQAADLTFFAAKSPQTPWVVLVDQSEETFWGGVMPALRGAAKRVWVDRMAQQSGGTESPYQWSEVQGKSRSQPDKLRVLGYTLGRPDSITPWLEALKVCDARIRGLYSPIMLTPTALSLLKIKLPKGADEVSVLVTPHEEGMRQTVLVGGRARFSRLALHPFTDSQTWFETVYKETARLREYLIGSGLLKNDRSGMHLFVVPPIKTTGIPTQTTAIKHSKDNYQWVKSSLSSFVYVAALAKGQPWKQLASAVYTKRDISIRISLAIYIFTGLIAAAAVLYLSVSGAQLWEKQSNIDTAITATNSASQQYQGIAKNFPPTPLTATQLDYMSRRWADIQANAPPDMRDILTAAGQTLLQEPQMIVENMQWNGEPPPKSVTAPAPGVPQSTNKEKREVASLILSGHIHGIASDDLRGTRDALARLEADFNRNPSIRAEITKKPLDLSTKTSLSGSGKQDQSELSFEIKLWQH